jgi:hypothetical protein
MSTAELKARGIISHVGGKSRVDFKAGNGHKKMSLASTTSKAMLFTTSLGLVTGYLVTNNALTIGRFSLVWPDLLIFRYNNPLRLTRASGQGK